MGEAVFVVIDWKKHDVYGITTSGRLAQEWANHIVDQRGTPKHRVAIVRGLVQGGTDVDPQEVPF